MKKFILLLFSINILFFLSSCGSEKAKEVEVKNLPEGFTLSKKSPSQFSFEIKEAGKFSFGLGVVYFNQQMQHFDVLKFMGQVTGEGGNKIDWTTDITIKDEKGWAGTPNNEEKMDWLIEKEIGATAELIAGKYNCTVQPAESESRDIPGMVELRFIVYKE